MSWRWKIQKRWSEWGRICTPRFPTSPSISILFSLIWVLFQVEITHLIEFLLRFDSGNFLWKIRQKGIANDVKDSFLVYRINKHSRSISPLIVPRYIQEKKNLRILSKEHTGKQCWLPRCSCCCYRHVCLYLTENNLSLYSKKLQMIVNSSGLSICLVNPSIIRKNPSIRNPMDRNEIYRSIERISSLTA